MPVACFLGRGKVHAHPNAPRRGVGGGAFVFAETSEGAIFKVCKGYKKTRHQKVLDFFCILYHILPYLF